MSPSFLNNSITKNVAIAAIACAILAACQGAGEGQSLSSLIPPPTPRVIASPPPVASATPIVLEPALFTITPKFPTGVTTVLHQRGDWTKSCAASPGSADITKKAVDCVLEVNELDLYYSKFDLTFDVPPATCSYGIYNTYHFYTHSVGQGPNQIEYDLSHDGRIIGLTNNGAGSVPGGGVASLARGANGLELKCSPFDHTPTGPNCCYGSYTAQVQKYKEDGTTDGPRVSVEGQWPGAPGNCVEGAGVNGVGRKPDGYPFPVLFAILGGGKETFSHESAFDRKLLSNVFASNFVRTGDPLPAAIVPGGEKYQFLCLDYAFEILGVISIEVREWNMVSEFVKNSTGDPDLEGNDPDFNFPYNARPDWLDFAVPARSSYRPGGFPGANL